MSPNKASGGEHEGRRHDPVYDSPVRLTLNDVRDEMFVMFAEQNKRLDKVIRFIEGDETDGSNGAKTRIDRLEQSDKRRGVVTTAAITASIVAVVTTAWKSITSGQSGS